MAREVDVWEARAEHDVGRMIGRYLAENPAPGESDVAGRLERIGKDLRGLGGRRLAELDATRLRSVP